MEVHALGFGRVCERCALVTAFAHRTSQDPIKASRLLAYPPAGDLPRASETSKRASRRWYRFSLYGALPDQLMKCGCIGDAETPLKPTWSSLRVGLGMTSRQVRKVEKRYAEQMPPQGCKVTICTQWVLDPLAGLGSEAGCRAACPL
jgi:hypothetical protein